jgi:hypothetical protein
MQAIVLQHAALDQLLHAVVADHAIADDDQGFQLVIHIKHPTTHHGLKSKKKRLKPFGSRRLCLFLCGIGSATAPDLPLWPHGVDRR